VFLASFHDAVIGIDAFVAARHSLPSLVPCYPQGYSVLWTEFLQFSHDTVCNDRSTCCIQARHHTVQNVQLGTNGVRQKVGIDKHVIRWSQRRVVLEKERTRYLRTVCVSVYTFRAHGTYISRTTSSSFGFGVSALARFCFRRASRWVIVRLTCANFLVFLARDMLKHPNREPEKSMSLQRKVSKNF
jgi:hypothetical protein